MLEVVEIQNSLETFGDTITLDSVDRHKRRFVMTSDAGVDFLLNLSHARLLRQDEGLVLTNGLVVKVVAKSEALLRITSPDTKSLIMLAWQIGNRHLPAQINNDSIYIRSDPIIRDMIIQLGGQIEDIDAPFNPEGGAYEHIHTA